MQADEKNETMTQGGRRRSLGRGLGALLGDATVTAPQAPDAAPMPKADRSAAIEHLHPGPFQPRRIFDPQALSDLAQSIREKGLLQPILVRKHPNKDGQYQIIAGERRWRASQQAQLAEVPIIVRDFTDGEALEAAIIENVQRQDLSPIEEGEGYNRLITEFGHTHEDLSHVLGKSRAYITNTLRLLKLPEKARLAVERGEISAGHARALLASPDPEALFMRIVNEGLSVRDAEAEARGGIAPTMRKVRSSRKIKDPNVLALEKQVGEVLGLRVAIASRGQSGSVMIRYQKLDQLDELISRLCQKN